MQNIKKKHIVLAYVLLILFAVGIIAGIFKWPFFIPAALALAGYCVLDKKCLRCPHCGGFTNLDRLGYAVNHEYHCARCGKQLEIGR